jgi:hypothetical protein
LPAAATTSGGSSSQSGLLGTAAGRIQALFTKLLHPGRPSPADGEDPTL